MKRHGRIELGSKTVAQKIAVAFRKKAPEFQALVRAEIAHRVQATRLQIADNDEGFDDAADQHEHARYISTFPALNGIVALSGQLPGVPTLGDPIDATEETYQPGGPPMSPVHDSLFLGWALMDLGFGKAQMTVLQIAREIAGPLQLDPELRAALDELVTARLGLYRVEREDAPLAGRSPRYRLRELVTDREIVVQFLEAYDIRTSDLLLVRAVELPEARARLRGATHVSFTMPYVIEQTTDPQWLDYMQRLGVTGERAAKVAAYEAIMRGTGDPRRWLEYVFVGYTGQRAKNLVCVVGIPDQPHTLPHHEAYGDDADSGALEGASSRERATILSTRLARRLHEVLAAQPRGFAAGLAQRVDAIVRAGGDAEVWQGLILPILYYEVATDGGPPLCAALAQGDLDRDDREYLEATRRGFTSIFEVVDVVRGERMRLRDLLGGDEIDVLERAGTMNLPTRIVVFARLVRYRGIWLMDGMMPHPVGPELRDAIVARVLARLGRAATDAPTPLVGPDVYEAMVAWQEVATQAAEARRRQPAPRLVATTGEAIAWSKAVLGFGPSDRPRVLDAIARLRGARAEPREHGSDGLGRFVVVDGRGSVEASIELDASLLTIESNTPGRLARVRKRIETKIPGVLELRTHDITPLEEMLAAARPRVQEPPSPEGSAAIADAFRRHYEGFLDSPVPALGGDSPRKVAKDKHRHGELDDFLRDHELSVTRQVGPGVIDFAGMRRALGLGKR